MSKIIGLQGNGVRSNIVGAMPSETASIAYTGELLPAGTKSYGSDIINTSFDSSAGWLVGAGWSVSGGKANVSNSGVVSYLTFGAFSPTAGKQYEVTFTVSNYVAGISRFTCGGVNGQAITANGTYTEIFVALSAVQFSLYGGTTAVCSFDNLTVKEVLINPNMRYYKNFGTTKTPALAEGGQGKVFNGTSQYINTGATPNDTVGTFITRFTYASGAVQKIMAGMNYSNNRCYMGINASGKIGVGFGANTYDTLFSPDVLVAGRSYHVAFRYSGSTYWLFVDSVLKATGTISGLTSFVGTSFFIGALNNGGTASNYFNNVIDETYYYDVALPDTAIQSLYLYPEKVKSYNGAIVPDIGSEANCKLFLPLCENSGSNVYNVAVNPSTALALVNYTTAMHTSAAKLSYGAQCTAWKRDSLGVLLGMSNGLSFDGGVSVKGVSTGITLPNTSTWAAEAIIYIDGISTSGYLKAMYGGSGNFLGIQRTSLTTNAVDIYCMARVYSTTLATGWHHIAVDAIGKFYIDGVLVSTQTPLFTGTPSVVYVGSDSSLTSNLKNIVSTPKIHKGTQYAKFNIAKSYAKALKTIAKLGA